MFPKILTQIFGSRNERLLKTFRRTVDKVNALESGKPAFLATANIGCLTHIQSRTGVSVKHWISVLDERLS